MYRLTSIPMGYTNSIQIFYGDTTFLLQEEIPQVTIPFIDDIPIKGPPTWSNTVNGAVWRMNCRVMGDKMLTKSNGKGRQGVMKRCQNNKDKKHGTR